MSIDWEVIDVIVKREASRFATKYADMDKAQVAYNAYYAGRMQCAAERESLRSILERKDKVEIPPKTDHGPEARKEYLYATKVQPTPTDNSLDDLI